MSRDRISAYIEINGDKIPVVAFSYPSNLILAQDSIIEGNLDITYLVIGDQKQVIKVAPGKYGAGHALAYTRLE